VTTTAPRTMGQVAQDAYLNSTGPYWHAWDRAADAVRNATRAHQRNGTPPWPSEDDVDHECDHDVVRALLPLLTTGSVECTECGRIVEIEGLNA
jgi:hypothetical protein